MSDETKDPSGMPEQVAGGESAGKPEDHAPSGGQSDSVKYETYKKVLSEAKKAKEQLAEYQEKLSAIEQGKLEAEGKKDELINQLRSERDEFKTKLTSAVGNFARGKAVNAIIDTAVKSGCTSTDLLRKAVEDKIDSLDFDDEFNPSREQVKMIVDETKKSYPLLFSKDAPKIADHNLSPTDMSDKPGKSLGKMKDDELMAAWMSAEQKR